MAAARLVLPRENRICSDSRPLPANRDPRAHDIALVQIFQDGQCESTIKKWMGRKNGVPVLEDGAGNVLELPEKTEKVMAVAVARAVIARL